ncbi:MAG: hypothetical protein LBG95_09540 [Treponema sp.]|jgi:hypothetical protein|nr:hypothetical protein [Treponema sp.]
MKKVVKLNAIQRRHGCRCEDALAGVFAEQKLQRRKLAWMPIFFAIALVALIGFTMTACDNGDNNNGNGGGTPLIMGKFASQTGGGGNAVFYADIDNTARSARAVTAEKTLAGKIEDGDIIFNLKGTYFPETGAFALSAGSSFLVYQIEGTVKNDKLDQAAATVKVLAGGNWVTHTVSVTATTNADDVKITGTVSDKQEDGIPQKWLGKWIMDWSYDDDEDGYIELLFDTVITPFAITIFGENPLPLNLFEVKVINSTTVECIIDGMLGGSSGGFCPDCDGDDPDCDTCENNCECGGGGEEYFGYAKITLKEVSANSLVLTMYQKSAFLIDDDPDALAKTRAFDIATADPDETSSFDMKK